ncbi:FG-GAP-like repeat-containing protein [Phaeobacter italicus]|uniref:FG-GAP-like repeat-containing protein n=1 Tax=Phaeobacter italicus TaxID=481446 RepID=UPI001C960569|nr:FG-GAP-like repeat-containing protein [Phaeobacter italicus]MBY6045699.1 VCBS repeat-containing protein [Phaeobacter italicus]
MLPTDRIEQMTTDITPTTILHDLGLPTNGLTMGGATDLNGDGLTDIVFVSGSFPPGDPIPSDPVILMNTGNGNFTRLPLSLAGEGMMHPRELAFGDINGDGDTDIVIIGHGYDTEPFPGETNMLLLSDGNGGFTDARGNLGQPNDFTHSVAVADIDGDGDLDVHMGNTFGHPPHPSYVLLNDGSGNLTRLDIDAAYFDTEVAQYISSHLVDLDADGQMDLVVGGNAGTPTRIFSFDPEQSSYSLTAELPNGLFGKLTVSNDVKSADLNNDGRLDLVLAQTDTEDNQTGFQVLLQGDDGEFSDATQSFTQGIEDGNRWVEFFDFMDVNDDGLMDIVTNRAPMNGPIAYLNTGGHFIPVTADYEIGSSPYLYNILDAENETVHGIKFYDDTMEIAEIPLSFYGANISVRNEAGIVRVGTEAGDTINGGAARDNLNGGLGNDRVAGYSGNDALRGGRGLDTLVGGAQNDTLDGGIGHDKLFGNHGLDVLRGGSGNDTLNAGIGRDKLFGNHGRDILRAGSGNDTLDGGVGHDKLFGERGMDVLRGGSGNDTLNGGGGRDRLFGGAGSDTFVFGANSGNDVVRDFVAGEDSVHITSGATSFADLTFENHGEDVKVLFGNSSILFRGSEIDAIVDADNFLF